MTEEQIIEGFRMMWKDRSSLGQLSISSMKEMIRRELRDELTHPRVRKTPEEKYRIALLRIEKADVSNDIKRSLKSYYDSELTKVINGVNSN